MEMGKKILQQAEGKMRRMRSKISFALKYAILFISTFIIIYSILSNDQFCKLFGVACAIISPSISALIEYSYLKNSD